MQEKTTQEMIDALKSVDVYVGVLASYNEDNQLIHRLVRSTDNGIVQIVSTPSLTAMKLFLQGMVYAYIYSEDMQMKLTKQRLVGQYEQELVSVFSSKFGVRNRKKLLLVTVINSFETASVFYKVICNQVCIIETEYSSLAIEEYNKITFQYEVF